jgi:hypothetical protein
MVCPHAEETCPGCLSVYPRSRLSTHMIACSSLERVYLDEEKDGWLVGRFNLRPYHRMSGSKLRRTFQLGSSLDSYLVPIFSCEIIKER